jgi:hypothetical protein
MTSSNDGCFTLDARWESVEIKDVMQWEKGYVQTNDLRGYQKTQFSMNQAYEVNC